MNPTRSANRTETRRRSARGPFDVVGEAAITLHDTAERDAAFAAELRPGRVRRATRRAPERQVSAAFTAELATRLVLRAARRAAHTFLPGTACDGREATARPYQVATGRSGREHDRYPRSRMNIMVLVKSIPDPNGDVVLGDDFLVNRDGEGTLDPGDEYAVEAALQLAEATDGAVTVVSMGPAGAVTAIRRALSMGAHGAVLIADDALRGADALATARVLAAAIGADAVRSGAHGRRVHGRLHRHAPDDGRRAPRRAGGHVRPEGGGRRRRDPRGASDRGRVRRRGVRAPGARHGHGGVGGAALPDAQGHHGRQVEAARGAHAGRPRTVGRPTSRPPSGWARPKPRRRRDRARSCRATRPQAASPTSWPRRR